MPGKLYLIPANIHEAALEVIPGYVAGVAGGLRAFIVEEEKSARRFLKKIVPGLPVNDCAFFVLNEHTAAKDAERYFQTLIDREVGLISEAGCPCVADPGAQAVLLAHQNKMEVIPLVGPSSIILALMASGLNGQNFAFNGYLPKDKETRFKKLRDLERRSSQEQQTQIFMETPYRNQSILEDILSVCSPATLLCVARDLTGPGQSIRTLSVKEWKTLKPSLPKQPALFLLEKRS